MVTDGEDALPPGDRVGAHHRVNSSETVADVLGTTTRGCVQLELIVLGALVEEGLRIRGCQRLQEFLIRLGNAVVDFVSGSPQCV